MTLSSTPGRPGKTAVFRKEFRKSLLEGLDVLRPHGRGDRRDLLTLTGVVFVASLVLVLLLSEQDGRPLFQARPMLTLILAIAVPLMLMAFFALAVVAMLVVVSLRDAFNVVTEKQRYVPNRFQRLRMRCSDLASYRRTLKELRDIRRGGLTVGNTPSLRAGIDDAIREGSRATNRRLVERRLAAKLYNEGERHRRELLAWLDSDESFRAALKEIRSILGDSRTETHLGPSDTIWVYNGPPATEASLRLLREFLPGKATPQGLGVVCTPREVYQLLLAADQYGSQPTGRYSNLLMRVTPRIGRESASLDGADPETVTKLYDPNEDALYSDLNELVAAAKLL